MCYELLVVSSKRGINGWLGTVKIERWYILVYGFSSHSPAWGKPAYS